LKKPIKESHDFITFLQVSVVRCYQGLLFKNPRLSASIRGERRFLPQITLRRAATGSYTIDVKWVGKLAALLLAVSLFSSPLMACMFPDNVLTAEERECCRQMAGKCGDALSSHSCCKSTVRGAAPYISSPRLTISLPVHIPVAILPVAADLVLSNNDSLFFARSKIRAPAESPPEKTSILRI
jgi:hypothetical protein